MELVIAFRGEVVERQELLNGTQSVTVDGASAGGEWRVVATVAWNLGVLEYAGEGEVALAGGEGDVYASLIEAAAEAGEREDGADWVVRARFEVDGGTGRFESASGTLELVLRLIGGQAEGDMALNLNVT
jgi:hypothetical protein